MRLIMERKYCVRVWATPMDSIVAATSQDQDLRNIGWARYRVKVMKKTSTTVHVFYGSMKIIAASMLPSAVPTPVSTIFSFYSTFVASVIKKHNYLNIVSISGPTRGNNHVCAAI